MSRKSKDTADEPKKRRPKVDIDQGDPLEELAAEINLSMGSEDVALWEEAALSESKFRLSTGSNLLDLALGGGVPTGRVHEVYGWPSTGKSTLICHLGASAQAQGGFFLNLDAEVSFDRDRAQRLGVQQDRFLLSIPRDVESGFETIRQFAKVVASYPARYRAKAKAAATADDKAEFVRLAEMYEAGVPSFIGWDTIAASPTSAELVGKIEGSDDEEKKKAGMMEKARIVREHLRCGMARLLAENHITLLFGNHLGENPKGFAPETPCGHAIKFWAASRIELRRKGKLVIKDREVGIYSEAIVRKSKFSPQGYQILYPITFANGVDRWYEAFDYLITCGVVKKNQAWLKIEHFPTENEEISLYYGDLYDRLERFPTLGAWLIDNMKRQFCGR